MSALSTWTPANRTRVSTRLAGSDSNDRALFVALRRPDKSWTKMFIESRRPFQLRDQRGRELLAVRFGFHFLSGGQFNIFSRGFVSFE